MFGDFGFLSSPHKIYIRVNTTYTKCSSHYRLSSHHINLLRLLVTHNIPYHTILYYNFTGNLSLNLSPYLKNSHGTGMNVSAKNARTEFPHPRPSASYIGWPANGRTAPTTERRIVFAASAEAEYRVYVSTRYMFIDVYNAALAKRGALSAKCLE